MKHLVCTFHDILRINGERFFAANTSVDHVDGNTLNNSSCNLRRVTKSEQNYNRCGRDSFEKQYTNTVKLSMKRGDAWVSLLDGKHGKSKF